MASAKQRQAPKSKRTIAHLPERARRELGRQAAKGARHGVAARTLEDRNCRQLYGLTTERNIPGRSKMGKWDLIEAFRRSR